MDVGCMVITLLQIFAIVLHSFGIYFLSKCYSRPLGTQCQKIQQLLLMNLAASELLKNCTYIPMNIIHIVLQSYPSIQSQVIYTAITYLDLFSESVYYIYFMANVYITADRLTVVIYRVFQNSFPPSPGETTLLWHKRAIDHSNITNLKLIWRISRFLAIWLGFYEWLPDVWFLGI